MSAHSEINFGRGGDESPCHCSTGAVRILERRTANWSRAEDLDLRQNLFFRPHGAIQGVIGQNDEMALGAIRTIAQMRPALISPHAVLGSWP